VGVGDASFTYLYRATAVGFENETQRLNIKKNRQMQTEKEQTEDYIREIKHEKSQEQRDRLGQELIRNSGDEIIANMNFYAVRPEGTRIR